MNGIVAAVLAAVLLLGATAPSRALELPEDAFETVPRAGFRSLLELRLAAAPERFDNDGFAIQHLSLDLPARSSACKETFIRLDDPASRPTLVREARSRLRGALARLSRERPAPLLRITTRERLAGYDPERELFRLEAIGGPRSTLLLDKTSVTFAARRHCQLGFHARQEPGGEAASRLLEMRLRLAGDARLQRFPMPLLDARAFLYRQVVLRGTREVRIEAVIETRAGADGLEGRVVQARVLEPGSDEPLHVFAPADPA
jgi:hypothetical protein